MVDKPKPSDKKTIIVETSLFEELEASWVVESSEPLRSGMSRLAFWVITRARHQAAVCAYAAILIALWSADVRAQHTVILSLAFVSIATVAVFTEWIGGKYYGHSRAER